jgi:hypothetical protein
MGLHGPCLIALKDDITKYPPAIRNRYSIAAITPEEVGAPLIAPSARKHGISDADMIHALNHPILADELAARFETHTPSDEAHDATELRLVREAFLARADAERALGDAVIRARHNGHSWASIGAMARSAMELLRWPSR